MRRPGGFHQRIDELKVALRHLGALRGVNPRKPHLGEEKAEQDARGDERRRERRARENGVQAPSPAGARRGTVPRDSAGNLQCKLRGRIRRRAAAVEQVVKGIVGWSHGLAKRIRRCGRMAPGLNTAGRQSPPGQLTAPLMFRKRRQARAKIAN